jgi:hypothetical protein
MKKIYFVALFGCLLSLGVIGYLFFKVVPSKKDLSREKIFGLKPVPVETKTISPTIKTTPPEERSTSFLPPSTEGDEVKRIQTKFKSIVELGKKEIENCEAEFDAFTGAIPSEAEDVDFFTQESNVQDMIDRFSQLNFRAPKMGQVYNFMVEGELAKVGSEWMEEQLQEMGPCRFEERAEFISVLLNRKNMLKWGPETQQKVKAVVIDYFVQSLSDPIPLSQVDHLLVQLEMMEAEELIAFPNKDDLTNIRRSFEMEKGLIEERMFEIEDRSEDEELGQGLFEIFGMEQGSSTENRGRIIQVLKTLKKEF